MRHLVEDPVAGAVVGWGFILLIVGYFALANLAGICLERWVHRRDR